MTGRPLRAGFGAGAARWAAQALGAAVLLALAGCSGPAASGPPERYTLAFQTSDAVCAAGTCGIHRTEFATIDRPTTILLDDRNVALADRRGDEQRIEIRLTARGFRPAVVVLQRDLPARLVFRPSPETGRLTVPMYGASFPFGERVLELQVVPVADFTWSLDGSPALGFVSVADDLGAVSRREVSAYVRRYLQLLRAPGD